MLFRMRDVTMDITVCNSVQIQNSLKRTILQKPTF